MYKVTKKFSKGPETQVGPIYKSRQEAEAEIHKKLADDVSHNVKTIYCLYEGFDKLEEFDETKLKTTAVKKEEESAGASQPGSGQRFTPTPFNMTPAPKGMPRQWNKDEEDKTGKK